MPDDTPEALETAYAQLTQKTLRQWQAQPAAGPPRGHAYPPDKLGLATGCLLPPGGALARLHAALAALAQADPLVDLVPADSLHVTFLALALDQFASVDDLPAELTAVYPLLARHLCGLDYRLCRLRLVPLPRALVLAGIPDAASDAARRALAADLLASAWRPFLAARYAGYAIPPLFWHTTLVRYRADYAPPALRALFHQFRAARFADLTLGQPQLVAASYDWSRRHVLPFAQTAG
ncbi:MAG: hypothetical protein KC425_16510 [Anaerolineales bacterium]|nr:hypothetical protein [Anaerolineales bacterium]